MSRKIMTALGPITAEEMGITSSHEHLLFGMPGWEYDSSYAYDRNTAAELCIAKVKEAQQYGLKTIVDATPMDTGRDPELCKIVQKETGVNIICSTGLYTESEGNNSFWRTLIRYHGYDVALKHLTNTYRSEIVEGVRGTDVRCGVIKVATGKQQISKFEELSIHSAALVQQETETPIISHTDAAVMGPATARMMLEKGVDPAKAMIGHMCDTDNLDLLVECMDMGFYVGFDRLGAHISFDDNKKCANLVKLVNMGYIDHILVGHDAILHHHVIGLVPDKYMEYMPNWNLCGMFRTFIPRFRELGLTEQQIQKILTDNPRRFFAGE